VRHFGFWVPVAQSLKSLPTGWMDKIQFPTESDTFFLTVASRPTVRSARPRYILPWDLEANYSLLPSADLIEWLEFYFHSPSWLGAWAQGNLTFTFNLPLLYWTCFTIYAAVQDKYDCFIRGL